MHQCGTTASFYHPLCLRMFIVGVYVCAKSRQNGWSLSFGWSRWATMGNPAIPRVWPIEPWNDRFFGGTTILLSRDYIAQVMPLQRAVNYRVKLVMKLAQRVSRGMRSDCVGCESGLCHSPSCTFNTFHKHVKAVSQTFHIWYSRL